MSARVRLSSLVLQFELERLGSSPTDCDWSIAQRIPEDAVLRACAVKVDLYCCETHYCLSIMSTTNFVRRRPVRRAAVVCFRYRHHAASWWKLNFEYQYIEGAINVVPRLILYQEHRPLLVSVSAPRACPLHTAPAARFPSDPADGQCDETFGAAVSGPKIAISTAFGPNVAPRALSVRSNVGWWPAQQLSFIPK